MSSTEKIGFTPRLLTASQAAEYAGLPLATLVRERLGRIQIGRYVRYDSRAIDAYLDQLSGLSSPASQANPNDTPEAALDRFLAAREDSSRHS